MTDKKCDKKEPPSELSVTSSGDINIFEPVLKRCTKAGKDVASVEEVHNLQSLLESGRDNSRWFNKLIKNSQVDSTWLAKFIDSGEQVSNRRVQTHSFYLVFCTSLSGAIFTSLAMLIDCSQPINISIIFRTLLCLIASIFGRFLAAVWWQTLENYRLISRSKKLIAEEAERKLSIRPFTVQYRLMNHYHYKAASELEQQVAACFHTTFWWLNIVLILLCCFYAYRALNQGP